MNPSKPVKVFDGLVDFVVVWNPEASSHILEELALLSGKRSPGSSNKLIPLGKRGVFGSGGPCDTVPVPGIDGTPWPEEEEEGTKLDISEKFM